MPNTSTDLANEALEKRDLVGIGQSPEPEDTARMLAIYPRMKRTLESEGIYSIADDNDIDDDAFNWLAEYLAYMYKPADGDGRRVMAEYHLKRITASRPTYEVMKSEYF